MVPHLNRWQRAEITLEKMTFFEVIIKLLRPLVHGDTVTVGGVVKEKLEEGGKVRLLIEISAENQRAEKTAVGVGSGLVE